MICINKTRNLKTHREPMINLSLPKSKRKSCTIGAFNSQKANKKINPLSNPRRSLIIRRNKQNLTKCSETATKRHL